MLDIFTKIAAAEPDEQQSDGRYTEPCYQVSLGGNSYPIDIKLKTLMDQMQPDTLSHWVSDGAWNMIDLLLACLLQTGPAAVTISSYAFSEKPARTIADLVHGGQITHLECLIDSRVDVRTASAITLIQNCAARCVLTDTHAKVTAIYTTGQTFVIAGSANYTTNRRWEAGIISTRHDDFIFHQKWMQYAMERASTD